MATKEKKQIKKVKEKKPNTAKREISDKKRSLDNVEEIERVDNKQEGVIEELLLLENEQTDLDKKERYYEAIGRRKEASARVRLYTKKASDIIPEDKGLISVNNKDYIVYFSNQELQQIVEEPLRKLKSLNRFKVTAMVKGGGIRGQAEAIRHGLSRTLVIFDENYRKKLRRGGLLTRDPREKERRKYGLKKARRAPQWSKR